MSFFEKAKRHPLLTKSLAVLLTVAMLIQLGTSIVSATGGGLLDGASPVISWFGTDIYDGMEVDTSGRIFARYEFTATRAELAGTVETISLPEPLAAAYETSSDIYGTDSQGNSLTVGTLSIDAGKNITVSFLDSLADTEASVIEAPAVEASVAAEPSVEESVSEEATAETPDAEEITVSFSVPVVFDTTDETVTVVSGGVPMTVTLTNSGTSLTRTGEPLFTDVVTINSVTVTDGATVLETGDTITTSTTLEVIYNYSMDSTTAIQIADAIATSGGYVTYLITLPNGLKVASTYNDTLTIQEKSSGTSYNYATITDNGNNEIYITFKGDFWDDFSTYSHGITSAELTLECALDSTKTSGQDKYTFNFPANVTLELIIDSSDTDHSTLAKSGKFNNNLFVWTVKFTGQDDATAVTLPITITDTYDNATMNAYVADSMKAEVSGAGSGSYSILNSNVYASNLPEITYTITSIEIDGQIYNSGEVVDLSGVTIELTYNTELTAAAFTAGDDVKVTNTATLTDSTATDPLTLTADATYTVPADKVKLLTKTGEKAGLNSDGNYVINWTVTVSSANLNIDNLVLNDTMGAGLTLIESSVIIKSSDRLSTNGTTYTYASNDFTISYDTDGDPDTNDFSIVIPKENTSYPYYAEIYTVTYSTAVDASILLSNASSASLKNVASLAFDWLPIGGTDFSTSTHVTTPNVGPERGVYIPTGMISKIAGKYDHVVRDDGSTINWTLTVNPNYMYVHDVDDKNSPSLATVTDTLPDGVTFDTSATITYILYDMTGREVATTTGTVDDGLTVIQIAGSDTVKVTPVYDDFGTSATLTFTLEGLGQYSLVIQFGTPIKPEYLVKNWDYMSQAYTLFKNHADFSGYVTIGGIGTPTLIKNTRDYNLSVHSRILDKSGSYDYSEKEITWTVTLNENKITLTDVVLTDIFETGLAYVDGSLKVYVGSASNEVDYTGTDPTVEYDDATRKLTVTFEDDITEMLTVTFKTSVDTDKYTPDDGTTFPFQASSEFTISNTITMTCEEGSETATGSAKVVNTILEKVADDADVNTTGIVHYSVNINPNGLDMTAEEWELYDDLPDALQLIKSSVKLYSVTVNTDGSFPDVADLTDDMLVDSADWELKYDSSVSNAFSVILPDASGSYVLAYDCNIVENVGNNTAIFNSIKLVGATFTNWYTADDSYSFNISSWAFFTASTAQLIITKVGSVDGEPVEGVTFKLYANLPTNPAYYIDEVTTNSDGEAVFTGLNPALDYYLVEVPAAGYQDTGAMVADAVADPDHLIPLEDYLIKMLNGVEVRNITITNDPITTDITFRKIDNYGSNVQGAEFVLTEIRDLDDGCEAQTVTSQSDGIVTFTGVHKGTYALTETAGLTGYYDNTETYTVTVTLDPSDSTGQTLIYTIVADSTGDEIATNATTGEYQIVNTRIPDDPGGGGGGGGGGGTVIPSPSPSPSPEVSTSPSPDVSVSPDVSDNPSTSDTPVVSNPGSDPSLPPVTEGNILVPVGDGSYIEINDEGVPQGRWTFDEESQTWIFDDEIPLGSLVFDDETQTWIFVPEEVPMGGTTINNLPQTGGISPVPITILALLGFMFLISGFVQKKRGPDQNKS